MLIINIIDTVIYARRGDQPDMRKITYHELRELLGRWLT